MGHPTRPLIPFVGVPIRGVAFLVRLIGATFQALLFLEGPYRVLTTGVAYLRVRTSLDRLVTMCQTSFLEATTMGTS